MLTVTGDPQKGAPHFDKDCASCHTSAFGRFLSDSPEITQLEGPYIFSQLKAFKSGQRNFTEETKSHRKMIDRIKQYSDEELADIVAYIKANAHTL
ncbi:c-type cytochrome [Litoribacillus peritrichatus]|uniref:Cytochrome c domain-containing protein n=1 Tax=Litoribacillus peritrichatus TaxID=718191 RepID=A0ABP7MNA6_9GAMM